VDELPLLLLSLLMLLLLLLLSPWTVTHFVPHADYTHLRFYCWLHPSCCATWFCTESRITVWATSLHSHPW